MAKQSAAGSTTTTTTAPQAPAPAAESTTTTEAQAPEITGNMPGMEFDNPKISQELKDRYAAFDDKHLGDEDEDAVEDETPETEPAKADERVEDKESEKVDLSEELVSRALDLDMDPDDIIEFAETGRLERWVEKLEGMQGSKQTTAENNSSLSDNGKTPKDKPEAETKEPAAGDDDFRPLSGDDFDPEIAGFSAKAVEKINSLRKENEEVKTAVTQIVTALREQVSQDNRRKFDEKVNALPDSYKDVLGEGPTASMKRTDARMLQRQRLANKMETIYNLSLQEGKPKPFDEIFDDAVGLIFKDQSRKLVEKDIADKVRKRRGQSIPPPSARASKGSDLSPEQKATQLSREFDRKHGL